MNEFIILLALVCGSIFTALLFGLIWFWPEKEDHETLEEESQYLNNK